MEIVEKMSDIFTSVFGNNNPTRPPVVKYLTGAERRTTKQKRRDAYLDSVLLDKIVDRLVKGELYDDELHDEVIQLEDGNVNKVQGFTEAEIAERVKLRRKHKNL